MLEFFKFIFNVWVFYLSAPMGIMYNGTCTSQKRSSEPQLQIGCVPAMRVLGTDQKE